MMNDNNYFKNVGGNVRINANNKNIRLVQQWNQYPYKERNYMNTIRQIQTRCVKNGIKKPIIDNSKKLYTDIINVNLNSNYDKQQKSDKKYLIVRGQIRLSLIAACLYYGS